MTGMWGNVLVSIPFVALWGICCAAGGILVGSGFFVLALVLASALGYGGLYLLWMMDHDQ